MFKLHKEIIGDIKTVKATINIEATIAETGFDNVDISLLVDGLIFKLKETAETLKELKLAKKGYNHG